MPQLTVEELHNTFLEEFPDDDSEPFEWTSWPNDIRADILMKLFEWSDLNG